MVPLPDYTSISGIPLKNFIDNKKINSDSLKNVIKKTRNGGGEIVSLMKDSSAFYSPACSAIEMLESFLFDEKKILPCSSLLNGEYGFKNVFVGVPVIIGKNGVEEVIELNLTKESKEEFSKSVRAVEESVKKCKKLLV